MEVNSPNAKPLLERRRLPRLKVTFPVQFRNVLKPGESFSGGLSENLSASGVRMKGFTFLPKETRLVLLLSLPGQLRPIRLIGRVAWIKRQRFVEGYECGVQFLEIQSQDRETIADTVEQGILP